MSVLPRKEPTQVELSDSPFELLKGKRDEYPPAAPMAGYPPGVFGTVEHDLRRLRRGAISPPILKAEYRCRHPYDI